jgi:hypothetical protein
MIEVTVANRVPVPELIIWLDAHGVDCITGYNISMAGAEMVNGDIHFYPKFTFNYDVDKAVLTEFSLRFS